MDPLTRWRGRLAARRALRDTAKARLAKAERGLAWARSAKRPTVKRREGEVARLRQLVAERQAQVDAAKRVIARNTPRPLRERAYEQATRLVGVMEHGANNHGPEVETIIRANGGLPGEAWCGDFVARVYRLAGSKAVSRSWAAVRLFRSLSGVRRVRRPKRGDVVTFTFDHVGMFVRDLGASIETIEGNTGASGAVSDSRTGLDGVYRKVRSKGLVSAYYRVQR